MIRILALDTTGEFGSLALSEGDRLVEEVPLRSPDGFAHVLFDAIRMLLERHEWPLQSIGCFAAASGPGAFTGLRVGLAAVKGLAEATGTRVAAVSNLQALACFGSAALRAVWLDARRGEIYGGLYDAALKAVRPEVVTRFPAWLDSLPAGPLELICPDPAPFLNALAATRFEHAPLLQAPRPLAAAVARIAWSRHLAGALVEAAAIDANYVRRADAELFWKDA